MSAEETPEETIKKLQFRLAAAEDMIEMQKNAMRKNMAKTMGSVQVLQHLLGTLNAEKEAAEILVEKLKRHLLAERAHSSLLKREVEQLIKAKKKTDAKKQVKASSSECQCTGGKLELKMAMRSSWLKFRLVIRPWIFIACKTREQVVKPVQWPDTDDEFV